MDVMTHVITTAVVMALHTGLHRTLVDQVFLSDAAPTREHHSVFMVNIEGLREVIGNIQRSGGISKTCIDHLDPVDPLYIY